MAFEPSFCAHSHSTAPLGAFFVPFGAPSSGPLRLYASWADRAPFISWHRGHQVVLYCTLYINMYSHLGHLANFLVVAKSLFV